MKTPFSISTRLNLRAALIDPQRTNIYRIVHGAADGWPGWYLDRLGDFLLSQSQQPLSQEQTRLLKELLAPAMTFPTLHGAYHKVLRRTARENVAEASPQHVLGQLAPERFLVRENGLHFELSFSEGYSVGLFLDQRDNRRRLLAGHVAAGFPLFMKSPSSATVLNTFAYTCGFSVSAAKAGARTVNVDLSRKYLEWGKRNFAANQFPLAEHQFIFGDVFDWLRRLAKKQQLFEVIVLDPPTFSRSKEGAFQVEKDYPKLVLAALPLLQPGGVLFASTNLAGWEPQQFLAVLSAAVDSAKRKIVQQHYVPQPPDFPISRSEPAYLKTVWMRIQ